MSQNLSVNQLTSTATTRARDYCTQRLARTRALLSFLSGTVSRVMNVDLILSDVYLGMTEK